MNDNQVGKVTGPVSDLPKTVPLVLGAPVLRANNPGDVAKLVDNINSMPPANLYALIGFIYGHRMMLVRNWTISGFILNRSIKKVQKIYKNDRYTAWITCLGTMVNADYDQIKNATAGKRFLPQSPEALERMKAQGQKALIDMRKATTRHIMLGKDREERSSAGGFSQRELNSVNNVVTLLNSGEPLTVTELRQKALGLAA